ncbi:glycosyltransferase family 1 protein [Cellulomonas sp. URHD0024]|uniref:glycosyltransferase family 4 protein n=1 Tax=Cellulomonas sp. URHD0024 TaxID=1302620 RepID=UPI0004167403|nr:glycosyltransferase family 1 protein [Cellulomonas sp. URHD0024]
MADSPLRAAVVVEQLWQATPGGSGTYVRNLVGALARRDDVKPVGLAARHDAPPVGGPLPVPVVHSRLPRTALYQSWQRLRAPRPEARIRGVQVVHATTWATPPTRLPLVVTVHDLAFLDRPEAFTPHGNAWFRRALDDVDARAAVVIVPSLTTADRCAEAGLDRDRLRVVPHGVDVPTPSEADVADVRRRYALPRPYVMWAGTVEPRKNLSTLLEAFDQVAEAQPDLDLVLVGPPGWGAVPVVPTARRERVRFTGFVPDADLHALYAGASAFAFPSLAEGFGLPVLEAMAHGVPVVTSSGTSCAEVLGDAGATVPALDADALARGLLDAIGAPGRAWAARGLARAATFSWDAAAEATLAAYQDAIRAG